MSTANTLREQIADFQAAYIRCIDTDQLEAWPEFFVSDCLYSVTTLENHRQGLPAGLIWANSQAMLRVSYDYGATFGTQYFMAVGRQGEFKNRCIRRKLSIRPCGVLMYLGAFGSSSSSLAVKPRGGRGGLEAWHALGQQAHGNSGQDITRACGRKIGRGV